MKLNGIIFSDLGQASSFMALDWVMDALRQSLGFVPYPATLNLRPKRSEDAEIWQLVQNAGGALSLAPAGAGFCTARLFVVEIAKPGGDSTQRAKGAVLLPHVKDYPKDKIEVVAPGRLKDELRVKDGDGLMLEFIH